METKKRRGGVRLNFEAGIGRGGGGIIVIGGVIGGAIVAAAIGAAIAARRARGGRNRDAIDKKEEEKGLQSFLPLVEHQQQENTSEKSEIGETIESQESEITGDSSSGSSDDQVVCPEEVIEKAKDSPLVATNDLKQGSEMTESFEDKVHVVQTEGSGNTDHREEEFAFDNSIEIQEMGEIQGRYKMISEIKESEIEDSKTSPIDGDVIAKEFSFWNVKSSTLEIHTDQNLTEMETNHVLDEQEEESCIEEDGEKRLDRSETVEASSAELGLDAARPETAIEQELEISDKTEDICVSEGKEDPKSLQDLIPPTNSMEQQKGQDVVDNSGAAQENAYNDFKMVAETLDVAHVEGEEEEEGSSTKSHEEMELQLEDVSERAGEESEGSRNSSVEFSDQAVSPEDKLEQEKEDDSLSVSEMKHQLEILRKIEDVDMSICSINDNDQPVQEPVSDSVKITMHHNESSENLEESDITNVELEDEAENEQEGSLVKALEEEKMLPVEEESEEEESRETGNFLIELEKCSVPMYEMINQELESPETIDEMVDEANAEGIENTTGRIKSFLPVDDKHKDISVDSLVAVQEKVYMNSDMETDIDLEDDIVKAHSYTTDVAFNSSQGQNQEDWEESEIAHVEEEEQEEVEDPLERSHEEETESSIEEDVTRANQRTMEVTEEEKGLPSIENEMKLQFEMPKKTTDFRQTEQDEEEHEQQVLKNGSETKVTCKEKRMDFVLIGSLKLFLLVLIILAVGLLAFAHHDDLHHYNHRLHKFYRQLYELFFPSYNGALGEI